MLKVFHEDARAQGACYSSTPSPSFCMQLLTLALIAFTWYVGHKDIHMESGQESLHCPIENIFSTHCPEEKWMRLADPIRFSSPF